MENKPNTSSVHRRLSFRRKPLEDVTASANNIAILSSQARKPSKLEDAVPRNESLVGNGTYAVRHTISSPKHKRVSQISSDTPENKRNSAISTTSTNASGTPRKRKTHIGPWQLGSTVGKGGTARVRKVRHAVTGQTGVAKIIPIAVAERARAMSLANLVHSAEQGDPTLDFGKSIPLGLEREIAIMKLLQHPNIVRLYDVWENRNEIYLIMEYVEGGELFDYVACHQRLPEDVTVYLFRQIIWALKYCHGINIHHRDLKPENILLDYDHMTVKLVDFGMAALQPAGNFLTTPCGSPHYAAPELLQNRPYDGSQADVWSAGVVLFVMLTGYPPFNFPADTRNVVPEDQKLKHLFKAISSAQYKMPYSLSREAQDLLRRIFVPDPSKRITIEEVWEHPFLHKYDRQWGEESLGIEKSPSDVALAEANWKPLKAKQIDRDIFRALRTLWHSESDTTLTDRLCNKEFNHEKFFYLSMLRYRKDNIESVQDSRNEFGSSASDYQHSKPFMAPPPVPSDPPTRSTTRSKSDYSITNDEHLQSRHSYYTLPVSEASYDPFRASRTPITTNNLQSEYVNVTVHGRLNSRGSRQRHTSHASRGESLRVEVLRNHSRKASVRSSKHSSASNSVRRSSATGKRSSRSSSSRISMTSSHLMNGSPLPVMRPSEIHRRGIQFSHLRKSSTGSQLVSVAEADGASRTPDHRTRALRRMGLATSPYSSPRLPTDSENIVRSKKGRTINPTPRTRKYRDNLDLEARKVSVELGKACDDAFFRSSMGSTIRSSMEDQHIPFDTPPSSISRPSPHGRGKDPFYVSDSVRNRPLPPTPMGTTRSTLLPSETPSTYTNRELTEMRDRLASKYARDGAGNQHYFNDVLMQLDKLMTPLEDDAPVQEDRRIVSAPPNCHYLPVSEEINGLHVIPEEGRFGDGDEMNNRSEKGGRRSITEPPGRNRRSNKRGVDTTIRVVEPSPPPPPSPTPKPWAPLNIRKTSTSSKSSTPSRPASMAPPWLQNHPPEPLYTFNEMFNSSGSLPAAMAQGPSLPREDYERAFMTPNEISVANDQRNQTYSHLDDRSTVREDREKGKGKEPPKKPFTRLLELVGIKKKPINPSTPTRAETREALFSSIHERKVGHHRVHRASKKQKNSARGNEVQFLHGFKMWFANFTGPLFRPAFYLIACKQARYEVFALCVSRCRWIDGITVTYIDRDTYTLIATVDCTDFHEMKYDVCFVLEVFSVSQGGTPVDKAIARITHKSGSATSLQQVALEVERQLTLYYAVVTNPIEAEEMKEAMFQGLRPI